MAMASSSDTVPTEMPDKMPLLAPRNLPLLVKTAFDRALASKSLVFYPTEVALVRVNSVPVGVFGARDALETF